jgi:hypothetical protein
MLAPLRFIGRRDETDDTPMTPIPDVSGGRHGNLGATLG